LNISVIGAGYVGLVSGLRFAELGNKVMCIEKMENRVKELNHKECPIREKDLKDLLRRNVDGGRFRASTNYDELLCTDLTFREIRMRTTPCPISVLCPGTAGRQRRAGARTAPR
jgi:UDP-glucose 6-dehydrogenase